MTLDDALQAAPIIAILRGVRAHEIESIADALIRAGVRAIEVPLNSPDPLETIARLVGAHAGRIIAGAGTVLSPTDVEAVAATGARLIVAPNTDPDVISRAFALGCTPMPGVLTPTEALSAHAAGARHLKLFPAVSVGPQHLMQMRAVLPADVRIHAVGGVRMTAMADWIAAGANGFGLGGELYRPGQSAEETFDKACAAVAAARAACA